MTIPRVKTALAIQLGTSARPLRALLGMAAIAGVAVLIAGCGGSGGAVAQPHIAPARTFSLAGFQPAGAVVAGRPTTISFIVRQPDGRALTRYRTGAGPHTGVHLIVVRDDMAYIIHEHPPIGANGQLRQVVTFPAPGPYKVLVDVYPNVPGTPPNFQLYRTVTVAGHYRPMRLPAFRPDIVVDGYHIDMHSHQPLRAIQAEFVHVDVTDAHGRKVTFTPWFGALAHAIFFRQDTLDYFHSHVCAPSAPNCGSLAGLSSSRVTGQSAAPGRLTVGVLLPVPGRWRLFLQMKLGGRVVTAPYTLDIS